MGTFGGHALPGSFFLAFGFWWTWSILHRYFKARLLPNAFTYRSTVSFSMPLCRKLPMEGIIKVVSVSIGITGELITAFRNGHFVNLGNGHHISMFAFFGLSGLVDILTFYKLPSIPKDLDYVAGILAFWIESLLFLHHLHGRSEMDVMLHMFLVYVVFACIIVSFLEMCFKSNVLPALGRAFFTILQGTWFWQVGSILYPITGRKWKEDSHRQMMIITMIFTWHVAAVFILLLLLGVLCHVRVKRMLKTQENNSSALLHDIFRPKQPTTSLLESDEEEIHSI